MDEEKSSLIEIAHKEYEEANNKYRKLIDESEEVLGLGVEDDILKKVRELDEAEKELEKKKEAWYKLMGG